MKISWIGLFAGLALLGATSSFASLESARELAAQGDPGAALTVVEEALASDPESADAMFLKGVLLVELRRADEAVGVYEKLIALHPELPEPYNNLAVIQAAGGDYESAVGTLRQSLQTNSSYRTAYENLTKIYSQLASEAYSQALDADSEARSDVVELVLLGTLASPMAVRTADAPKPEAQIAAAEPTAVSHADPGPQPTTDPPAGSAAEAAKAAVREAMAEAEAMADATEEVAAEAIEATEEATEVMVAAADSEPEAEADQPEHASVSSVASFVESWRAAWQGQDADGYLGSYSVDFVPADGSSREAWAEVRRERVTNPEFIRVTLAFLDEPHVNENSAEIRFLQSYESNTFQDRVTKTLSLIWEEDGWKILEERTD